MDNKLEISALNPLQEEKCNHYWVIGSPEDGVSHGYCKHCGVAKEFKGYGLWTKGDTSLERNIN
jgi:hypothetical protein